MPWLDDGGWSALYDLLDTAWSNRVWIIQEFVMAPENPGVRILKDRHIFSMERLALAMSVIYKYNLECELKIRYPARFAALWTERIRRKMAPSGLEVIARNWMADVTGARDKIYGLRSLLQDFEIKVDYKNHTVTDVFVAFTCEVIWKHRNLALLGALSAQTYGRNADLPSWVPDWTSIAPDTRMLISPEAGDEDRSFMHFNAASKWSTSFVPEFVGLNNCNLQVEGLIIDTIPSVWWLGPVHRKSSTLSDALEFFRKSEHLAHVHDEHTIVGYGNPKYKISAKKKYPHTGEPLLFAYYATLTMDDLHHRHEQHRFDIISRTRRLRKLFFQFHELIYILRSKSSNGLLLSSPVSLAGDNSNLLHAFLEHPVAHAMSVRSNRRIVRRIEQQYLGLFPERIYEGDSVVLLKGARVPFVLRKSTQTRDDGEELWGIVGDAYVYGIMAGEAWDETNYRTFILK